MVAASRVNSPFTRIIGTGEGTMMPHFSVLNKLQCGFRDWLREAMVKWRMVIKRVEKDRSIGKGESISHSKIFHKV